MSRFLVCVLASLCIAAQARAQDGWLLFRADAQRSGTPSAQKPWKKPPDWQRPLLLDKYQFGGKEFDADPDDDAKAHIDQLRPDVDPAILPGSFPLMVGKACVYRSHRGLVCVALQPIVNEEDGVKAIVAMGEINWKSIPHSRSFSFLMEKKANGAGMRTIMELFRDAKQQHWLWANPMVGSLSSDGKIVVAINDMAVPVDDPKKPPKFPRQLDAVKHIWRENYLLAYDVESGKLMWDTDPYAVEKSEFIDSHFLGAPLPLNGKLFVLNEKAGDLRLVRIDLDRTKWKRVGQPEREKALVLATLPATERVTASPLRRTQALHLALAGDFLVCPTHAGVLVGVDRAAFTVRWTYRYRDEKAAAPALPSWQAACAIVGKDRIVFTAADSTDIHCLDFKGAKQWRAEQIVAGQPGKDLYLAAIHDDIVLVVGKTHCRALKLKDGSEKWKVETSLPAGVGVKNGSTYLLPIVRDPGLNRSAILAIDLAKGTITRRIDMPYPQAIGNLALDRGVLVSQSVTHVAAFALPMKK